MAQKTPRKKQRKQKQQRTIPDWTEPIVCELLSRGQYAGILPSSELASLREGTYHSSFFREVEGWGVNHWVVGAYLDVDYKSHIEEGLTIEEVLAGCFIHLNQPPLRKKYQRRSKNPVYGNLEPMPIHHGYKEIDGKDYIWVLFVTDKRKCKYFWGEGIKR